ncbi:MAG: hypothetical protein E7533_04835 [Ruminococcaceae bacterium]|nr:hypothetical protein [Oscillospiraceae bacterium]
MKRKKIIIITIAVILILSFSLINHKTDTDKIIERFEIFEEAYSAGDLDGCIECLDAQSRNSFKGIESLGPLFGFNTDLLNGLFALGVTTGNEEIEIDIKKIAYSDDAHAQVTTELRLKGYSTQNEVETVVFDVVKEENDWYIVEHTSF